MFEFTAQNAKRFAVGMGERPNRSCEPLMPLCEPAEHLP
jgi:hypothetical protein